MLEEAKQENGYLSPAELDRAVGAFLKEKAEEKRRKQQEEEQRKKEQALAEAKRPAQSTQIDLDELDMTDEVTCIDLPLDWEEPAPEADDDPRIEEVTAKWVTSDDIYITLGSPWVPADVIDDFILHIFKDLENKYWFHEIAGDVYNTKHDEYTGSWEIPLKSRYSFYSNINHYSTGRVEALHILERTLNGKSIIVEDSISSKTTKSGEKKVINKAETTAALDAQRRMIEDFKSWVWTDPARKERLERIYNEKFCGIQKHFYDGSRLTFPGMSPDVELYPYQKNAVARMISTPNTLLAHDVGSGKTYEMIAAGMELKRTGKSEKNLFVVPNDIVGQWETIFRTMYPDAKLIVVEPKTFKPAKRESVIESLRDDDYDGAIIAYSCFEQIPISLEYYKEELREAIDVLNNISADFTRATKRVKNRKSFLQEQLFKLETSVNKAACNIFFDQLGVTRLFIDEAHNFKNIPISTMSGSVLGISTGNSKKCKEMLAKVRVVQKNGGGVVLATGTPITNSITDAYVIQTYLQHGTLELLDLQSFDSWVGMFAEKVTNFEIDVDTSTYRLATRYSRFHNLPELTMLFSQFSDFHKIDKLSGIPDCEGYTECLIPKTQEFEDYLKTISKRAEAVRSGCVDPTEDNMLMITTDGRKAALDLRLVDPTAPYTTLSKASYCAKYAARLYHTTDGTQLIFCDTSTPKEGFNLYDELKRLLTLRGVKSEEIAFIHDASTKAARNELFRQMRCGEVRILIGSTFKLGIGVNVQDKLIAIHHLDIPWRPADMTQREGRMLRQGNLNERVYMYRYTVKGSFDAYSWQLLETKQRFINDLLSGSYTERSGTEIEDSVLSYAEVKALAVGDPLIKKRVEVANELSRMRSLNSTEIERRARLTRELDELPARINRQNELIQKAMLDKRSFDKTLVEAYAPQTKEEKALEAEQRKALRERIFSAVQQNVLHPTERTLIADYRGFSIVLPAFMSDEKYFVYLVKRGRYYVELDRDSDRGVLTRLDNFLEKLEDHITKLGGSLADLTEKGARIREELEQENIYPNKIISLKAELENIDKALGVEIA